VERVVGKSVSENRIGKLQNTNGNKCAHAEVKWQRGRGMGRGNGNGSKHKFNLFACNKPQNKTHESRLPIPSPFTQQTLDPYKATATIFGQLRWPFSCPFPCSFPFPCPLFLAVLLPSYCHRHSKRKPGKMRMSGKRTK